MLHSRLGDPKVPPGNGKIERAGLGTDREPKEASNTAFNFLKANSNRISGSISTTSRDYIINYQDVLGEISISGAKKVLLPITSAADLGTAPAELVGCFSLISCQTAEDAVFKALGVE